MAVTIHLPKVHRPSTKRLAVIGFAVATAAVAFAGVQALSTTSTTAASTTAATSDTTANAASVGAVDTSALAEWAQQHSLTGASATSLAPLATTPDTATRGANPAAAASIGTSTNPVTESPALSPDAVWTRFDPGAVSADSIAALAALGIVPDTSTTTAQQSGGFATYAEFADANIVPETAVAATTTQQSGGFATYAEFADANFVADTAVAATTAHQSDGSYAEFAGGFIASNIAVATDPVSSSSTPLVALTASYPLEASAHTNADASPVEQSTTNYDPYPVEQTTEETTQPRSAFASDIDWIRANNWSDE